MGGNNAKKSLKHKSKPKASADVPSDGELVKKRKRKFGIGAAMGSFIILDNFAMTVTDLVPETTYRKAND